ncbi:MAG TPA: beta-propeller domain-containing protein, partial [Polyangiaceae bacterium]|nr:beta-propeller domain-containing protein [Polyangiaceae bacterium]
MTAAFLSAPRRHSALPLLSIWLWLPAPLLACSEDGSSEPDGVGGAVYDSASPGFPRPAPGLPQGGYDAGSGSIAATITSSSTSESSAISEAVTVREVSALNEPQEPAAADIVRSEQGRLYVLAHDGGLSVIDASVPDDLRLIGQDDPYPFAPVALFVRGGIVLELFEEFGTFVYSRERADYVAQPARSIVRMLDASDPGGLTLLDEVAVPGTLLDSRLAGHLLYLVTESGFPPADGAGVFSLDISDPARITPVDEIELEAFAPGVRHVPSFSAERLYLGVVPSQSSTQPGSSIFVVDLSDPTGLLIPGATIQATGEVWSRWALDESEGVLRVVSQRYSYDNSLRPSVETFRSDGSGSFVRVGVAELSVPPGQLRSVRFDGSRGYALTQRGPRVFPKDPGAGSDLISIDLADP